MSRVQVNGPCGIIEELEANLSANDVRRHFQLYPEGNLLDHNKKSVQSLNSGEPPYSLEANPSSIPYIQVDPNGVAYANLDFVSSGKVSINLQEMFHCLSHRQVYGGSPMKEEGPKVSAWKERGQEESVGFKEKGRAKGKDWNEEKPYALKDKSQARPNEYKEEGRAEANRWKENPEKSQGEVLGTPTQIAQGALSKVNEWKEKVHEWVEKRR